MMPRSRLSWRGVEMQVIGAGGKTGELDHWDKPWVYISSSTRVTAGNREGDSETDRF